MSEAVNRALGAVVRLFGAALALYGAVVWQDSPETGVPLVVFGVLFAVWPGISGLIANLVGDLLELR